MTRLIQQLHDELVRRQYAASTIESYVKIVEAFRQHAGKRLDRIGPDDLRRYHVYLLEDRKLAVGTVVIQISALRFLLPARAQAPRHEGGPAVSERSTAAADRAQS